MQKNTLALLFPINTPGNLDATKSDKDLHHFISFFFTLKEKKRKETLKNNFQVILGQINC